MKETMLREVIEVYSEKYGVRGEIKDYGIVTKLLFSYMGRDIEMGISRTDFNGERRDVIGREIIETYIAHLADQDNERKVRLHYWHIYEEDGVKRALGVVTGHDHLPDSNLIYTPPIKHMYADEANGELVITTENGIFFCPLEYCIFDKQDKYPDLVPDYERIRRKYRGKIGYPFTEPRRVLLNLSDFSEFYFHSISYRKKYDEVPYEYSATPHIGNYQDSLLISVENSNIDIRYFPHFKCIEMYLEETGGEPLFVNNIGYSTLFVKARCGLIKLEPGDMKEVKLENTEKEDLRLPDGDLYPARIIEGNITLQ